jgi:hypothetical protein
LGYTFPHRGLHETHMPSNSGKWIRSVKDNSAGKVVADPEGNRWEWQSNDDTSRLLKKLNNDELAIESTDIHPTPTPPERKAAAPTAKTRPLKPGARDSGVGFDPYDHAGKKRR